MFENHKLTEKEVSENIDVILTEINEAFKFAKDSPFPDQSLLNQHIYKD
jgi:TPP-dependent pyruvate/acetoin dehydrogenase alpha subunit